MTYLVLLIIIIFAGIAIYVGSAFAVIYRRDENNVPFNIVSVLILLCPIINTLLALYYLYPEFKEILSKNKFSIPYVYGLALVESGKTKSFTENSDFRFFKNEIPKINDMLLDFPEEERLDFYKFASALGCFSTEKMLDKKGKETQVPLAQKATSLLAQLLKTDEMKLR